jgi:hypothetical protein
MRGRLDGASAFGRSPRRGIPRLFPEAKPRCAEVGPNRAAVENYQGNTKSLLKKYL